MSLFNSLQISVTGVEAQATQLGIIGTNIANSTTTGYKGASVEFQTLLGRNSTAPTQNDGGVQTAIRYGIANQGAIATTTSATDLAINGGGFFLVQPPAGGTALTRAGSFVSDASGNLVNTAGYTLMGYNLRTGALEPVNVGSSGASVTFGSDGIVSTTDASGNSTAAYRIPLANVMSPQNMTSLNGDVFEPSADSGAMTLGSPTTANLGSIDSSALESSSVNLTTELTNLISTESAYGANSKAMTTSSDMLSSLFQAAAG
jgi:flagellar hook protein FlgE